jgi:hypothetical protein
MKIVKLKGGLGNQMFQYTYAKLLQKRTGDEIHIDYSSFEALDGDNVRVPRIEQFKLSLPPATKEDIKKICILHHSGNSRSVKYRAGIAVESVINRKYYFEKNRAYIKPEDIMDNNYFDGYWQSWRYVEEVKDKISKDFVPRQELSENTKSMQKVIQNQNAVFIGVRRGDYSNRPQHYGSFGSDYYQNAMKYISEYVTNPIFYIFSNDIEWCKNNLDWGTFNVIYRESDQQTSDFEELMLMASCKHAIIINSSFHWWGATLIDNANKIVCCPIKWWFDDKPIDIIPDNWVRIENV